MKLHRQIANLASKLFNANGAMVAVLTVGLLGLGFSVMQLESIFEAEHRRNIDILAARKQGIENYAAKLLQENLRGEIDSAIAAMPSFLDNPLLDASNYFWQQGEQQRIPFTTVNTTKSLHAKQNYQQLQKVIGAHDNNLHWSPQNRLLWQLQNAVTSANDQLVENTVRQILAAILDDDTNVAERIAYRLVMLEVFSRYGKASPALIEKLLRKNIEDEAGSTLLGLQKQLLLARPILGKDDFDFFKEKTLALSIANNVPTEDFVSRIERDHLPLHMSTYPQPGLTLYREGWVVERDGDNIFGVRMDKQIVLRTIEDNMHHLGLIERGDRLSMLLPEQDFVATTSVKFEWQSETWNQAVADVERFSVLKTTTLLATAVVLAAVTGLAWWMYRKQARWIDTKSEFVATVSHELRTPLSGIRLMAERLSTQLQGDDRAKDYPQRIIADVDTLSFLADNILSYERINSGQWISHKSPVALQEVVADLQRELPAFVKKPFVIQHQGNPDTHLYADPVLIKLLFMNLAKNSCTYNSREQALINISWQEDEGYITVSYQDNGCGFNSNEIEDCFSAFYRGHHQRHTRGSGLGLALCRKIAALHDGSIAVLLTGEEGTLFRLRFKVANHE